MSYPQSTAFKDAIKKLSRATYISGTITTTKGKTIEIKNDDISPGSLYITNQCVNDDSSLRFGAVYSAECGITFETTADRYSLFDAEIELSFFIKLDDGTYEECKLGKFYVSEPTRKGHKVTLKAYDAMLLFDASVQDEITGAPFEVLSFICELFGIQMAQTQDEIEALVNGDVNITVSPEYIKTYREALSYISCLLCGFCYIDNNSALKIGTYKNVVSDTIEARNRTSTTISDFHSYFKGVAAQFEYEDAFENFVTISEESDGLLCNMGSLPIVLNTTREYYQQLVDKMYEVVSTITHTPCSIGFNGDPSIELGDMIEVVQRDGTVINSLVTFFKWVYRGTEQIKCAGGNPKLPSSKKETNAEISRLQSEIAAKSIAVYTYTNATKMAFTSKETQVLMINISSIEDTKAMFNAMFEFELSNDAELEFRYYFDSVPSPDDTVIVYCNKGKNVISLVNSFSMLSNARASLQIKVQVKYIESDKRKADAKVITYDNFIAAAKSKLSELSSALSTGTELPISFSSDLVYEEGVVDETIPTCVFEKNSIRATLFGQGLAGTAAWDGTITFNEFFEALKVEKTYGFSSERIHEQVSVSSHVPIQAVASDGFSKLQKANEYGVASFEEEIGFEFRNIPIASASDSFTPVTVNVSKYMLSPIKVEIQMDSKEE